MQGPATVSGILPPISGHLVALTTYPGELLLHPGSHSPLNRLQLPNSESVGLHSGTEGLLLSSLYHLEHTIAHVGLSFPMQDGTIIPGFSSS